MSTVSNLSSSNENSSFNQYSDSDFLDDAGSDSDTDILSLCEMISESDENILFAKQGYRKLYHICTTLQGELFKAEAISDGYPVAIKAVCKRLTADQIAIQNDITFCVNENIKQEAFILKQLTNANNFDNIVRYIDFFESSTHYYLVTEYIEGMKLNEFIQTAHKYIASNKLNFKHHQKFVRYIIWKLANVLNVLHNTHRLCHLDLCLDNIILENVRFTERNGAITLPETDAISVKLIDFGVSEIFDINNVNFECYKHALNIDNEAYYAPKIFDCDYYDARKADVFALGMILYECMTGNKLYKPIDMGLKKRNGYLALHNDKLRMYVNVNNLSKYFTKNSLKLLILLLNVNEEKRVTASECIEHNYFKLYSNMRQ